MLVLFDLGPKENRDDLFGRGTELKKLSDAVKDRDKLIVIYGLRRVGKTSLLHVFLNEKEIPYALIDVRSLYLENGYVSVQVLCRSIINEFEDFVKKLDLDLKQTFDTGDYESITEALKKINLWCKEKSAMFVVAFDEAQYLRFSGRTKYDMLIAWSIDNLSNVAYILTGSEIGTLREFLKYNDVKSPLYGRFRDEIVIERFDESNSRNFLIRGFKERGMRLGKEEINNVIASIDGIAGWLTYYGNYRGVKKLSHKASLQKVYSEGSKIALAELERLIARSRNRYLYTLKAIANDIDSWADIKDYVMAKSGRISDVRFSDLLESLIKFGFVEKIESAYKLTDPVLLRAVKGLKK